MSGCDKKDDSSSKSDESGSNGISQAVSDSDVTGKYIPLEGFRNLGSAQKVKNDYDAAIRETNSYINSESADDPSGLDKLASVSLLELKESGAFEAYYTLKTGVISKFSGSYKLDDGQIRFEYEKENRTVTMRNYEELESPEESWARAGDDDLLGKQLELLNTIGEGTYFQYAAPMWFAADHLKFDMCVLPMPMGMRGVGQIPVQMSENVLKEAKKQYFTVHNGVLCADTAGWELDGEYKKGESFTVKFDPMAAADDWYFYDDDTPENKKGTIETFLKTDKITEIKFSSGKWEWINADGETLNTGSYTESGEIDGLFCMYPDENSEHGAANDDIYQFMYISGSQVYYPYAFKVR